jgi:two-component system NarL family sensor kinase
VQELLDNVMKHAAAKSTLVQLSKTDQTFSLTVEDDGKGFDTVILQGTKGIGWSNIQTSVAYIKGKADVKSEPAGGTSVHIELTV